MKMNRTMTYCIYGHRPAWGMILLLALVLTVWLPKDARADTVINGCTIVSNPTATNFTNCPGANLAGTNLSGAILNNANFTNAILGGANLSGAILNNANFTNVDFTSANLTSANLSSANLEGASLRYVTINHTNFTGANLTGVNALEINLTTANLTGATLTGSTFNVVNLSGVNLSGFNLTGAKFPNSNLTNANLSNANLTSVTFYDTDLTSANLTGVNLSNSTIVTSKFIKTVLTNANLAQVNLSGHDFSGANLSGAKLNGAQLVNANLNGADLSNTDFTGANLSGINFDLVQWNLTLCPDGTNSSNHNGTCVGYLLLPLLTVTATKADNTPYTSGDWSNQRVTVQFTCTTITGRTITTCPAAQSFTTDGQFTATGEVQDSAGFFNKASFAPIWIDLLAPDTTITAQPGNPSALTNATFAFTGTDGSGSNIARFECSLEVGAFSPCTSPQSYTGLNGGPHTFRVRAVDNVGNISKGVMATWSIDVWPPDTTITAQPANPSTGADATFTFTGNDGNGSYVAGFQCSLDNSAFSPCPSPQSYAGLRNGLHTFQVRAVDPAGNSDASAAQVQWTVAVPQTCYWIESKLTGFVLDINGANPAAGTQVIVWPKRLPGGANQLWTVNSDGSIASKLNGYVLDITGSNTAQGTKVITWPKANPQPSLNQQWNLVDKGSGDVAIQTRLNGNLLDINGGSTAQGTLIIMWPQNTPAITNNQLWRLVQAPAAACAAVGSVAAAGVSSAESSAVTDQPGVATTDTVAISASVGTVLTTTVAITSESTPGEQALIENAPTDPTVAPGWRLFLPLINKEAGALAGAAFGGMPPQMTWLLLGVVVIGLVVSRRRRKRKA